MTLISGPHPGEARDGFPRLVPFSHAPDAKGNVQRGMGDLLVENAPFSRVFHAAVIDTDGSVLYDLPAIAEPRGAIALPVDERMRVGLIRQWRPVPARDGQQSDDALDYGNGANPGIPLRGFWSIEVPRGYPREGEIPEQTARREAEEELGVHVSRTVPLGTCNFNTSIMLSDINLFAVLAHPNVPPSADSVPDDAERIERVEWHSINEVLAIVSRGEIRCGLTQACLLHLIASRSKIESLVCQTEP